MGLVLNENLSEKEHYSDFLGFRYKQVYKVVIQMCAVQWRMYYLV